MSKFDETENGGFVYYVAMSIQCKGKQTGQYRERGIVAEDDPWLKPFQTNISLM